jgi:hypothetical protein
MLDQVRIDSKPMMSDSNPTENKRVINYWPPLICCYVPILLAILFVGLIQDSSHEPKNSRLRKPPNPEIECSPIPSVATRILVVPQLIEEGNLLGLFR